MKRNFLTILFITTSLSIFGEGKENGLNIPDSLFSAVLTRAELDSIYTKYLEEAKSEKAKIVGATADYYMAYRAYEESLMDLSQYYLDNAMEKGSNDTELMAECYNLASILAQRKGNLEKAIINTQKEIELERKLDNKENLSASLNNIAGLYLTANNYEIAKRYIDEAIQIEKGLGRSQNMAVRLGMASEIELKMGNTGKSYEYANEAFRLDSTDGRQNKTAIRRCQRAAVLQELGRYDEAIRDLYAAIPVLDSARNLQSLSIAYAQIGEILHKKKNLKEAEQYLTKCVEICNITGNTYIESRGHRGLYKVYKDEGKTSKALEHHEKMVELQNEINSDKSVKQLALFNVQYETLKIKLSMLEKERTIAEQKQEIIYGTAGILFLSVVLVLVIIIAILKKRAARMAEEKNAVLIKQALEKDKLIALAQAYMSAEVKEEVISIASDVQELPKINLTARELEIARMCAQGMLNKEIANELNISPRTVETHRNNLYRKLGINNTVELLRYMQKVGL